MQSRRSSPFLSVALYGAAAWLLASFVDTQGFLSVTSGSRINGRTAMRGFKEDFAAWKKSLSNEDKRILRDTRKNTYDKKTLKDPPVMLKSQEKQEEFAQIVQKFLDTEALDYKKANPKRYPPDAEVVQQKITGNSLDISFYPRIVEIDRDAERRWEYSTARHKELAAEGGYFPINSPQVSDLYYYNNGTSEHNWLVNVRKELIEAIQGSSDLSAEEKTKHIAKMPEVPPLGEIYLVKDVPVAVLEAYEFQQQEYEDKLNAEMPTATEEEKTAVWEKTYAGQLWADTGALWKEWKAASAEVEAEIEHEKEFFRNMKDWKGKTKADVYKETQEIYKKAGQPFTEFDDDEWKELAKIPALSEQDLKMTWGYASKLWRSEACDQQGNEYLLGVFNTPEEAVEAFNDFNAEYEQAQLAMNGDLEKWEKDMTDREDAAREDQEAVYKDVEAEKQEYLSTL